MNFDQRSFTLATEYKSIRELKNAASKIESICAESGSESESKPISFLSENDLDEIIFLSEKSAVSCRKMKEILKQNDDGFAIDSDENPIRNYAKTALNVRVNFDGKMLRITTPYTFRNKYSRANQQANLLLQLYVRDALNRWKEENNFDLYRALTPPLVLVIKRRTVSDARSVADNDNIENGRIANTIMNALGVSDNWQNLSLYSCVERVTDSDSAGMEFTVLEKRAFFDLAGRL